MLKRYVLTITNYFDIVTKTSVKVFDTEEAAIEAFDKVVADANQIGSAAGTYFPNEDHFGRYEKMHQELS